jgi:hypothetical protein
MNNVVFSANEIYFFHVRRVILEILDKTNEKFVFNVLTYESKEIFSKYFDSFMLRYKVKINHIYMNN